MAKTGQILQVAMVWRNQILAYRLLTRSGRITVGPSKRATLTTPPVLGESGRFVLIQPRGRGYLLRLAPGMRGDLHLRGEARSVIDVLSEPAMGKGRPSDVREALLEPGDRARLKLREGGDLRIEVRFVDPAERIPRPRSDDPQLTKITTFTASALGALAFVLLLLHQQAPPKTLTISKERLAKLEVPIELTKKALARNAEEKEKKEEEERRRKEQQKREAQAAKLEGQTKRAEKSAGKLGRQDATLKDTIIPKGEKDVLREKVSKVGLLGLIGKEKPAGSGLSKLLSQSTDVEQAVAGMAGAKLVAGRGSGGLSTSGSGPGGGGTGYGHIYGSGNLDTGGRGAKGRGRGPSLGTRGEKEVKVSMTTGNGESDGSLSKEQIEKVVRAHAGGIKYCYEKELQRKPTLAGAIDMFWVILPDGTVQKANVKNSTLDDVAVEGCIARQVKQWHFPKAPGQTVVAKYPFLFKGGV
jgi:hypothetical protein